MKHAYHYQNLLRIELERRSTANPAYSLRSFARDLQISPAQLSKILNGKLNLSQNLAKQIAARLYNQESQQVQFILLAEANQMNEQNLETQEEKYLYTKLNGEDGYKLQDRELRLFYSSAMFCVFESLSLKNPAGSDMQIADRLGLSLDETQRSLSHLASIGLISYQNGNWQKNQERFQTSNGISSETIRNLHKQFIGKALNSIDNLPTERRYLRGYTVSLREQDLQKVRTLMENFLTEVARLECQAKGSATELYQVNLQFFDLQKKKEKSDVA